MLGKKESFLIRLCAKIIEKKKQGIFVSTLPSVLTVCVNVKTYNEKSQIVQRHT